MAIKRTERAPERRNGVDIRMFRHGFGDCFLLSIHSGRERPFTMMIDCGLLKGTPAEAQRLAEVARCIRQLVPDGHVDVLAITHPHYDHVSGFLPNRSALKVFRSLTFGQLWLPWTEDLVDPIALAAKKQHLLRVLALKASADMEHDLSPAINSMLDFYGTSGSVERSNLKVESELAIKTIREKVVPDRGRHHYWRAGDTAALPGGACVYFFGPEYAFDPSGAGPAAAGARTGNRGGVSQEQGRLIAAIERRIGPSRMTKLLDRFHMKRVESTEMRELSIPFERQWRIPAAATAPGDDPQPADSKRTGSRGRQKRDDVKDGVLLQRETGFERISALAPDAPFDLAVRLDEETNKTSLAMAIELPNSGRVLLFPGDAPSSDWKMWQELTWPSRTVKSDVPISGKQLLANTVFYKVSQRGCATGTSAANGLSLLNPNLIAMLPIDQSTAQRRGWNLPFPPLLDALRAKTKDRVICASDKPGRGASDPNPTKLLGPRYTQITIEDPPRTP